MRRLKAATSLCLAVVTLLWTTPSVWPAAAGAATARARAHRRKAKRKPKPLEVPLHLSGTLQEQLDEIASRAQPIGATIVNIETLERASVNGDKRFPMASVYKLPIAIHLLWLVDEKKLSLDQQVPINAEDLRPDHSPIARHHPHGGATFTIRELLEYSLEESDNTAADKILELAGGPAPVMEHLHKLSINNMDVSRSEKDIALEYYVVQMPPGEPWSLQTFNELRDETPKSVHRDAQKKYETEDMRDTTTPDDMALLLYKLQKCEVGLHPETNQLLLNMLGDTITGRLRIRGLLPKDVAVAHKTGTYASSINDVGIVTLPNGQHVAMAIFVNAPGRTEIESDRIIAWMAQAAWDHFTGTTTTLETAKK